MQRYALSAVSSVVYPQTPFPEAISQIAEHYCACMGTFLLTEWQRSYFHPQSIAVFHWEPIRATFKLNSSGNTHPQREGAQHRLITLLFVLLPKQGLSTCMSTCTYSVPKLQTLALAQRSLASPAQDF